MPFANNSSALNKIHAIALGRVGMTVSICGTCCCFPVEKVMRCWFSRSSRDRGSSARHSRQPGHDDPAAWGRSAVFRHRRRNGTGGDRRIRPYGQPDSRCCSQHANQGVFVLDPGGRWPDMKFRGNASRLPASVRAESTCDSPGSATRRG